MTKNDLGALIRKVGARIPNSVTPETRIEIHPSEWLMLVDALDDARTATEPSSPAGKVSDGEQWYCPACGTSGPVEPKREHPDPYKRCQHDLLKPASTIIVTDTGGRCVVCLESWNLRRDENTNGEP